MVFRRVLCCWSVLRCALLGRPVLVECGGWCMIHASAPLQGVQGPFLRRWGLWLF